MPDLDFESIEAADWLEWREAPNQTTAVKRGLSKWPEAKAGQASNKHDVWYAVDTPANVRVIEVILRSDDSWWYRTKPRIPDIPGAASFKDKQKRLIRIMIKTDITAFHNGREVGKLEIDEPEGEDSTHYCLRGGYIDEGYQQAGIGLEMLRLGKSFYGAAFRPPPKGLRDLDNIVEASAKLVKSATELGYVLPRSS